MEVKIKKLHKDAVIPKYAKPGDAGMDLTAISMKIDEYGNLCYGTGLAFEIPNGYVGLIFHRSSNHKKGLILSNAVGVIDSSYRGEVSFKFRPLMDRAKGLYTDGTYEYETRTLTDAYKVGDRIGQIIIMPYPQIEFVEVEELSETERGANGYGSSGR